jgi:hypothetical protein
MTRAQPRSVTQDALRGIGGRPGEVFRLCLDLNVWYAAYRADSLHHEGTAAQTLVGVARLGHCALGPTQIVVSWGMLNRLRTVLEEKLRPAPAELDTQIEDIAMFARVGAAGLAPFVLLGGTGLMPLRDPEDAHVLDTAVAGDAHVLATANSRDFVSYRTRIVEPGRIAVHQGPRRPLIIAHPFLVARWVTEGQIPAIDSLPADE